LITSFSLLITWSTWERKKRGKTQILGGLGKERVPSITSQAITIFYARGKEGKRRGKVMLSAPGRGGETDV